MKTKAKGGYNNMPAAPYSANPRTGERIDNPARLDPRNAAAERQSYSRAGSTKTELQADLSSRAAARKDAAQRQESAKVKARRGH